MNYYKFLWKGKDPEENLRSEEVFAENASAAKEQLIQRGWTDLEMVSDETGSLSGENVQVADWTAEQPVSPEKMTELFEGRPDGFFAQWWAGLVESKFWVLFFAACLGWGIYRDSNWLITSGAIGFGFIVLLAPALHLFFGASLREYSRLNKAKVWGRWNEVLDCVERLRKAHRLTRIGVGDLELARCRAQALAAMGRLEEGLAEFQQFENSPKIERWFYLAQLSSIYDEAKDFEKSLECRRKAAEEKPDNASVWVDLAYVLARGLNRPAEAREALVKAETLEVPGLGKAYLPFLRGVICWREGNFAEAQKHLEEALIKLERWKHHDLVVGLILLAKSYLCAVQGGMGNHVEAQKLFRETEKFLVAHRETELLQACRSACALSSR